MPGMFGDGSWKSFVRPAAVMIVAGLAFAGGARAADDKAGTTEKKPAAKSADKSDKSEKADKDA